MSRAGPLLILLLVWGLGMIIPDLVRIVQPLGSFGFYASSDGLIYDVAGPFASPAASPATKAGLIVGDRIDLHRMSCYPYDETRCASVLAVLGGLQYVLPDRVAVLDLAATHDKPARQVTIVSAARPSDWLVRLVLLVDAVAGILVVAAAGWLTLIRPGRMSWGFFLYALWFNPGQSFVFYAFLQQWPLLLLAQNVAGSIAQGVAYAGLLQFVLRVPNDAIEARWRPLERAVPWLGLVFALSLIATCGNAFGYATESLWRAALLGGFVVDGAALIILLARRRNQSPADYQRMRWVIWGCAIGLPAFIIAQLAQGTTLFSDLWGATPPYDILGLLFLANGVFCLFVFGAIRHTRVVSVSIPLRRVTLLGFTLSIPALLLHNEVEHIHEMLDLPDGAWLAVGVVTLYLISRLHEFAVKMADRYFNRRLDRAESSLDEEILRAKSPDEIDRLLADKPYRALRLASAAIFRRTDTVFERREDGNGWDESTTRALDPHDPMFASMTARVPFNLDDAANAKGFPVGIKQPIVAVPVANRVHCFAVALYGPHASGTDLDANERAMLARLGDRAADCYAQLENEALKRKVAALESALSARASPAPVSRVVPKSALP